MIEKFFAGDGLRRFKRDLKANAGMSAVAVHMPQMGRQQGMTATTLAAFHLGIATEGREYQYHLEKRT